MQTVSIDEALANARRLAPTLAERQATEILQAVPGHPEALLILANAKRLQGRPSEARDILELLAKGQPRSSVVHFEWALTQAELGALDAAIASVRHALRLKPTLPGGWRFLGDLSAQTGQATAAEAAYASHVEHAAAEPALMLAGRAMLNGELPQAEDGLRGHLARYPTDVAAMRMLAESLTRRGQHVDAQSLLEDCLAVYQHFTLARHNLAVVLYRQNKPALALPHLEFLRAKDLKNPNYRSLQAACLAMTGSYEKAIEVYESLLVDFPEQPKIWLSFGHALKTVGRAAESAHAYRKAAAQAPDMGEAYWSLANMKTEIFSDDEVRSIYGQLARPELRAEDCFHLHYTLGHILERRGDYAKSWSHYAEGARIRRGEIRYDATRTTARLDSIRALMTASFFADRFGSGCTDEAPIFIVGLPRSGSTLIEQILSCHSQVEGTMELSEIAEMARELCGSNDAAYPAIIADLGPDELRNLGGSYLDRTRKFRTSSKPIFIDKMPNNFVHIGLIRLILPRARIIDARRHPMAACFSAFKQHFAKGQPYTYDLAELGKYYRDYVALMDHFDQAIPGYVYRSHYEQMVEKTEEQTRALLDHCDLRFEETCLFFYDNLRAVRTASSEQVRRPIYHEALESWRNYAAWLDPLAEALG